MKCVVTKKTTYGTPSFGEYAALVLSSLLDNAPTQQWWESAMNLDKCRVNSTNITKQLPLKSNPMQSLIDRTNGPTRVVRYYATNPFCTPKCLKGLLRGGRLDPACPNVGDHGDEYHEIDGEQFVDYLEDQLTSQLPQFELQPLHIAGNGNQFLRGTLEIYGYSFLVKAAESHAEERLEAEFDLYEWLTPLQGICIPICVGLLDLKTSRNTTLIYNRRTTGKMLIMSWEGIAVARASEIVNIRHLGRRRSRIHRRLEEIGMRNVDLDLSNFVCNPGTKSLKLVNFRTAPDITSMRR
ncbi:hypothetical protein EIK77_008379 [Talaromyces pinophilus]|nr:hypothetical protein EIK77_008379 [Talaromyces pinophilus]